MLSLLENLGGKKSLAKAVLMGVILIAVGLLFNCKKSTDHVGNKVEVIGCSTVKYEGEIFDLPNNCKTMIAYTARDITSESGKHRASIQVTCLYNCINGGVIVEYH